MNDHEDDTVHRAQPTIQIKAAPAASRDGPHARDGPPAHGQPVITTTIYSLQAASDYLLLSRQAANENRRRSRRFPVKA
jgi:hypothetical protein